MSIIKDNKTVLICGSILIVGLAVENRHLKKELTMIHEELDNIEMEIEVCTTLVKAGNAKIDAVTKHMLANPAYKAPSYRKSTKGYVPLSKIIPFEKGKVIK